MSDDAPQLTDEQLLFLNSMFDLARDGKVGDLASCIDQGIPVNLTNSKGDTLLILAAYHQQPEVVDMLVDKGADLDRLNERGQTAIVAAVFRQDSHIVTTLLNAGADPLVGSQSAYDVADFFDLDDMRGALGPRPAGG